MNTLEEILRDTFDFIEEQLEELCHYFESNSSSREVVASYKRQISTVKKPILSRNYKIWTCYLETFKNQLFEFKNIFLEFDYPLIRNITHYLSHVRNMQGSNNTLPTYESLDFTETADALVFLTNCQPTLADIHRLVRSSQVNNVIDRVQKQTVLMTNYMEEVAEIQTAFGHNFDLEWIFDLDQSNEESVESSVISETQEDQLEAESAIPYVLLETLPQPIVSLQRISSFDLNGDLKKQQSETSAIGPMNQLSSNASLGHQGEPQESRKSQFSILDLGPSVSGDSSDSDTFNKSVSSTRNGIQTRTSPRILKKAGLRETKSASLSGIQNKLSPKRKQKIVSPRPKQIEVGQRVLTPRQKKQVSPQQSHVVGLPRSNEGSASTSKSQKTESPSKKPSRRRRLYDIKMEALPDETIGDEELIKPIKIPFMRDRSTRNSKPKSAHVANPAPVYYISDDSSADENPYSVESVSNSPTAFIASNSDVEMGTEDIAKDISTLQRCLWNADESYLVYRGVREKLTWAQIKLAYFSNSHRSNVAIKDRWRSLQKNPDLIAIFQVRYDNAVY